MKLTVSELKKNLKDYEQKELIQLITDLHKMNKDVQSYLSVRFLGEVAIVELYHQAKEKVENEFLPEKGFGKLRLNEAKKAISDFKKVTGDDFRTTELMLYYVEKGVEYTNSLGDINENFYLSVEKMYEKVISICNKNDEYYQVLADRLKHVVLDSYGIGWGFHDQLADLYSILGDWGEVDEENEKSTK